MEVIELTESIILRRLATEPGMSISIVNDSHYVRSYILNKISSYVDSKEYISNRPGKEIKISNRIVFICCGYSAFAISRDSGYEHLGSRFQDVSRKEFLRKPSCFDKAKTFLSGRHPESYLILTDLKRFQPTRQVLYQQGHVHIENALMDDFREDRYAKSFRPRLERVSLNKFDVPLFDR